MTNERINCDESEGYFNDFIDEKLDDLIDGIISDGDLDRCDADDSDLIVEIDDIKPPKFTYSDNEDGTGGVGQGPGNEDGKLKFELPFDRLMEMIANKLKLPDLKKEGKGSIKEVSYRFKTFGSIGVVLDKKRTFKRALKSSIGLGLYCPEKNKMTIEIRRRDKRFKIPVREEIPKYKAVCFYIGDISYSTYGERLELEKRLLNFVHHWVDYSYGHGNVEHRYFVHDMEAYEVNSEDFYKVSNVGGTEAAIAFELVGNIAFNEYDSQSTNFYAFYVGDGELFGSDAKKIVAILNDVLRPVFNRVSIVEVKPSTASSLNRVVAQHFQGDRIVRTSKLKSKLDITRVIKKIFSEGQTNA